MEALIHSEYVDGEGEVASVNYGSARREQKGHRLSTQKREAHRLPVKQTTTQPSAAPQRTPLFRWIAVVFPSSPFSLVIYIRVYWFIRLSKDKTFITSEGQEMRIIE